MTGIYDVNDGRDWAWSGEAESVRYLRDLVGHRHVVETLEALSNGPTTVALMTRQVRVGRRGLAAALRIIGARGLLSTSRTGSWDAPAPRGTLYCLNDRGRAVVTTLSRQSVWTMLVEGSDLDGQPESSTQRASVMSAGPLTLNLTRRLHRRRPRASTHEEFSAP